MDSFKVIAKDAKKKKASAPKKAPKVASPAPNLSTEFVQESDLEEDEPSDEASANDDEDSLPNDAALSLRKSNGKTVQPATAGSSPSGSESESAEDDDDDDDEEQSRRAETDLRVVQSVKPVSTTKTVSFKAPPYKPPTGFLPASVDGSSKRSKSFDKSHLGGKEIWYITAPTSVPISSIRDVSLASIQKGNASFSHNDSRYGLAQDLSEDSKYLKIMLPSDAEETYKAARSIDRILKVKESIRLPSVYTGNPKERNLARLQPSGMRMRFHPIGVYSGQPGHLGSPSPPPTGQGIRRASLDEEMQDAPPQFRRPASLEPEESKFSSSDDENADNRMIEAPSLKTSIKTKPQALMSNGSTHAGNQSLKRKHDERREMKVKNSSSSSTNSANNKELKTVKKKQKRSQAGDQSTSTENVDVPSQLRSSSQIPKSHILPPDKKQSGPLSDTVHIPEVQHKSKEEKKPKKKRDKAEVGNDGVKEVSLSTHQSSTIIPPPKRSFSIIPPPNSKR